MLTLTRACLLAFASLIPMPRLAAQAPSPEPAAAKPAAKPALTSPAGIEALLDMHGALPSLRRIEQAYPLYAKQISGQRYLSATKAIFDKPLSGLPFGEELTSHLYEHAGSAAYPALLQRAAQLIDSEFAPEELSPPSTLAEAATLLEEAHALSQAAFAAIDAKEHEQLVVATRQLLADFVQHIYVHKRESNKGVWQRVQRIDWSKLFAAQQRLLLLAQPEVLQALRKDAMQNKMRRPEAPGVEGSVLWAKQTAAGLMVIGGGGKNRYDGDFAFVLDLGGQDRYAATATRSGVQQRVNLVCDLRGDDEYAGDEYFAQGCGLFGNSLLVDLAGNDRYEAKRAAQGCGVAGVGMLIDVAGNDAYSGDAYVHGAGCFGLGALIDRAGDDKMQAGLASMGFGWPLSAGFLIDLEGNDLRTLGGKYGSSYGTKGEFNALGHGASVGFRTLANGGFGVVVDGGGDDVSKVGEFGFGCGYFFGCGIVRDFGGNDIVEASRYGIATGAHFGLGFVYDDAGNDSYSNRSVAALAGNWDLTVSFFVDRAGDDSYLAKGLSIGCATITSVAGFFDLGGNDRYVQTGNQSFGRAGHPQDADRKLASVALFVDVGGGEDLYPKIKTQPEPANGMEHGWEVKRKATRGDKAERVAGRGVFVDR
jgi:hypothetical protein